MKYRLTIELGRLKNVNKNPVAEIAVRELECELVHQQPTGGTVTQLVLSVATANLNTRVRNKGFLLESCGHNATSSLTSSCL